MRATVRMLSNQGLDDSRDLSLLTTGQLRCFLEDPPHFPDRSGPALLRVIGSDQFFNGNAEDLGQHLELIRSERHRVPFPPGISGMFHAQFIGNLLLRQTGRFPQDVQSLAERRALPGCRSSCLHAGIINDFREAFTFGLHGLQ